MARRWIDFEILSSGIINILYRAAHRYKNISAINIYLLAIEALASSKFRLVSVKPFELFTGSTKQ